MSVRSWRSVGALLQNLQKLTVQRDSKFCRILDQTVLVNFSIKPEQIRYGLLLRHTYKFMAQHAWRFQMETITEVNSDVLEWYWKVFKVELKIHFVNASQWFRSRSPLSSPLVDWVGIFGSTSSRFLLDAATTSCVQSNRRLQSITETSRVCIWKCKHWAQPFYIYLTTKLLKAPIGLCDVFFVGNAWWRSAGITKSSSICQGWRERGPWAKPLASEDMHRRNRENHVDKMSIRET